MKRILLSAAHPARRGRVRRRSPPAPRTAARPAPTRSSSTTPSGWSPAPTSRSPASRPGRSRPSTSTRRRCTPWSRCTVNQGRLRPVPPGRHLRVAAPVADRRVLRRLQPRHLGPGAQARRARSRSPTPSRRSRPTWSRTSCGCPTAQRFTLIINELGAAAAARSGDLQAALHRAVPALDETDNLLNLLANDSTTLQNLTRDSNTVITALANNNARSSGSSTRPTAPRPPPPPRTTTCRLTFAEPARHARAAAPGDGQAGPRP